MNPKPKFITCSTLEKSQATLKKGCSIKASYQLCSHTRFNFTDYIIN